jgi:predicted CopG family antitoxin
LDLDRTSYKRLGDLARNEKTFAEVLRRLINIGTQLKNGQIEFRSTSPDGVIPSDLLI